jgi:hypothetical protein
MLRALILSAAVLVPALAQADATARVIVAVDSYERDYNDFDVMATLSGEAAPKAIKLLTDGASPTYYSINGDSCERALLLLMNRPGRFSIEVRTVNFSYSVCRLVRQ